MITETTVQMQNEKLRDLLENESSMRTLNSSQGPCESCWPHGSYPGTDFAFQIWRFTSERWTTIRSMEYSPKYSLIGITGIQPNVPRTLFKLLLRSTFCRLYPKQNRSQNQQE